jgi:2-amino-1-hydroxyethylphosphonate dioxygenase (glycine-forming)
LFSKNKKISMLSKETAILQVIAAFRTRGHEAYHGEPVSQLEHAVQSALLAQKAYPGDAEFVLAAFLHDFGHLCDAPQGEMDGYGTWDHEAIGADALRAGGFSEKIAQLVANHVCAKRYLVSTDPAYFDKLSEASKITLEKQGGPLSSAEQRAFEQDPLFELHLALRRLDEQAKIPEQPLADLSWLENLMRAHFSATFATNQ